MFHFKPKIIFIYLYLFLSCYKIAGNTTEIILKENNRVITPGSTVYIDQNLKFPNLEAELTNINSKALWQLTVKFNRQNRNNMPPAEFEYKGSSKWNISKIISSDFVGGLAIIKAEAEGNKYSYTFNIRGVNPSKEEVLDYIGDTPWYAKAIALHEAGYQNGQVLCQFNELGNIGENYIVNIKNTPNRGHDMKGWGIFQITKPEPSSSDLWNWKKNIDTGKKILESKKQLTKSYFEALKRTYPDSYESPPNYTPPGTRTKLTPHEVSIIQLYNGGSVIESLKNPYGKYSNYVSSWKFYPDKPSGKRWQFIPNRNNYVKKIIVTYENI